MSRVIGLLVNMVFLVVGVGGGLVFTSADFQPWPIGYPRLILSLISLPATVVFLLWILSRLRPPDVRWPRPSLWYSPLQFKVAPLSLFLIVGVMFATAGAVGVVVRQVLGRPFDLSPVYFLVCGCGVLIGLGLSMRVFSDRIEPSGSSAGLKADR